MKPPSRLAGRSPHGRISVLKSPVSGRFVLGESEPVGDDRRARAATQHGQPHANPRHQPLATIDQPLPPRLQTALSYRIAPAWSERLQGGPGPDPMSRRAADQRVQVVLHVDSSLPSDKDQD